MIPQEAADAQGIGGRNRHDVVRFPERCGCGIVTPRPDEVVRHLLVGIECTGDVDDRLLDPLPARVQRRAYAG
ncbi:hypothetical protein [Microbacterium sp. Se63.02b]|uniref:hypothetical protein n=2 Tax=unclassified Microbacterium TaxID=2609290 RepID=UPI001FCEBEFC|nr:hypothetical protein [Microbacterium sp. Se63.02b]